MSDERIRNVVPGGTSTDRGVPLEDAETLAMSQVFGIEVTPQQLADRRAARAAKLREEAVVEKFREEYRAKQTQKQGQG